MKINYYEPCYNYYEDHTGDLGRFPVLVNFIALHGTRVDGKSYDHRGDNTVVFFFVRNECTGILLIVPIAKCKIHKISARSRFNRPKKVSTIS